MTYLDLLPLTAWVAMRSTVHCYSMSARSSIVVCPYCTSILSSRVSTGSFDAYFSKCGTNFCWWYQCSSEMDMILRIPPCSTVNELGDTSTITYIYNKSPSLKSLNWLYGYVAGHFAAKVVSCSRLVYTCSPKITDVSTLQTFPSFHFNPACSAHAKI